MTLYLAQDTTSGDVFVTDERTMSDPLHFSEWQREDGAIRPELDLSDFELDPDQPFPERGEGYRYLA